MPILGPTARRLSPILTVTEQLGYWLKGRAVYDPDVAVELSFEMNSHKHLCFAGTPWTVINMARVKQNLFEFNLGYAVKPKGGVPQEVVRFLADLRSLSVGHNPIAVTDHHVSAARVAEQKAYRITAIKGARR